MDTLNLSSIPKWMQGVRFSGSCHNYSHGTHCYGLPPNVTPLPRRPGFSTYGVHFAGFKAMDGGRIPLNRFLSENKDVIRFITVSNSHIGYIDRELFAGFAGLRNVNLRGNDIHSIRADAFEGLTDGSDLQPVLVALDLGGNRLEQFDWSALHSLKDCLEHLDLNEQTPGLTSITRSGSSTFATLMRTLDLRRNRLQSLPDWLLYNVGLDNSSLRSFDFRYNAFCENPAEVIHGCGCCDLKNLVRWATTVKSNFINEFSRPSVWFSMICEDKPVQFTYDAVNIASGFASSIALLDNTLKHC
ncbi:uncharacterized protein LOC129596914 isoform X2 [Paramacrobiotus metropolitanus]|nr:uncharacterized protein LOC129596914 isoform X2 [Paramacrobiotus metropolitanus]